MSQKSYILKYALMFVCCVLLLALAPELSFALAPRLESTSALVGAEDSVIVWDCPVEFVGAFKEEWNRAADFTREMGVKKGDRVLVVGGSPMFLPIFLAVNGIDCTFVDVSDLQVYTIKELLAFYAEESGNAGVVDYLHWHQSLFQNFDTDMEFDHVTLFDIFFMLKGGAPEKLIQNAVRFTKDSGTLWLGRNYSSGLFARGFDTEQIFEWTPFGAFLSPTPGHKDLSNPNFPGGYFVDSLNTAYTVHKDDKYHLMVSA